MSHVESLDAAKSKGPENFFFKIYSHELTKQLPIPYQKSGDPKPHVACLSLSLLDITYRI